MSFEALHDNFKFGGNLIYFTLWLTDKLAITDFSNWPATLEEPTFGISCSTEQTF